MINFPPIEVNEVWGESPLFEKRCWLVYWPLSSLQVEFIDKFLTTPDFWNSIKLLVPNFRIPPCLLSELEVHESTDSCFLEAVFCLAKSILSPTALKICPSKNRIKPNGLYCAFESNQHEIAGSAIQFILNLLWESISRLSNGIAFESSQALEKTHKRLIDIIEICCGHSMTAALLDEAESLQIPVCLLDAEKKMYHLGAGVYGKICISSMNDSDSFIGVTVAQDKCRSHSLLESLGFPVPSQIKISADISDESVEQIAAKIRFPCVVKPSDTDRGEGVTSNIQNCVQLKAAINFAKKNTNRRILLIQKHFYGADFRLNVAGGRVDWVVKRSAPVVIGNGIDTVKVCIEKLNLSKRSMRVIDGVSTEISLHDKEMLNCLSRDGLSMESVIDPGQIVSLRTNSNVSTGGSLEEIRVEDVHPKIISQCLSIAKTFRLESCGIDYITTDISLDPLSHPGAFIEVNSMPQRKINHACHLIQNMFPVGTASTIPCTLLLANWGLDSSPFAAAELKLLIDKQPFATIAFPSVLFSESLSFFDDHIRSRIHLFRHPKELIINKFNSELICLLTPDLLLKAGWILPRSQVNIVNLVGSFPSSDSQALSDYVEIA
ncbi:hypothetical protein N9C84_04085 [Desulfobacterales bacterium]|nr:hypothetical protein [Desulfobacterales bacterium]